MRILAVTPWFPTDENPGEGIFNLRDVELLARRNEVKVLHLVPPGASLRSSTPGNTTGIEVQRVPFALSRPSTFRGAVRALRDLGGSSDLVHSMAFPALFPTKWARLEIPWVHTEHWSALVAEAPTILARLGSRFLRRVLAAPDAVVAVGSDLAAVIDGYREDSTRVIANRVEIPEIQRVPELPPAPGGGELRLVAVGSMIERKGPIQAVETVAELVAEGIDAHLEWIGAGELSAVVAQRAAALSVDERVTLPGHLAPPEVQEALLNAHVFLLPTAGETFGVSIAEALGCGLPVVVTGVGGHLEFLPERGSRHTPNRTGAGLAAAVLDLINDPGLLSNAQIRAFAAGRFSEESRGESYARVYSAVMEQQTLRE